MSTAVDGSGTKTSMRDVIVVGFAVFAVFFGAGNLIFPPFIGAQSGTEWALGLLGLALTGVALPIAAIAAVSMAGGRFQDLSRPITRWFHHVYNVLVMFGVGTLITIPRTGAVAYETGVKSFVPDAGSGVAFVSVVIFFALVFLFSLNLSAVADRVGTYLTPILLVLLLVVVGVAVFDPVGSPMPTGETNPFYMAFSEAYQTGDVLTGLLCAVIFVQAFHAKGVRPGTATTSAITKACIVGFVGLFVVYGGLEYLGATGNAYFAPEVERTALLTGLVERAGGSGLLKALAVAVLLACLTTAVGLTAVVANYVREISQGAVPQWAAVAVVCVVGVYQALGGVERIVSIAGPIFLAIYPVSILMVLLGLFTRFVPNDGVWKGSALLVIIVSLYESMVVTGELLHFEVPAALGKIYSAIPLAEQGFAWIVPAIVGGFLGAFIWRGRHVNSEPDVVAEMEASATITG